MTSIRTDLGQRFFDTVTNLTEIARELDPSQHERTQYAMEQGFNPERSMEVAQAHRLLNQKPEEGQLSYDTQIVTSLKQLPKSVLATLDKLIRKSLVFDKKWSPLLESSRSTLVKDLIGAENIQVNLIHGNDKGRDQFSCRFQDAQNEARQFDLVVDKNRLDRPIVVMKDEPVWYVDSDRGSVDGQFYAALCNKGVMREIKNAMLEAYK